MTICVSPSAAQVLHRPGKSGRQAGSKRHRASTALPQPSAQLLLPILSGTSQPIIVEQTTLEGKEVQFEVGRMARLADGSCRVLHGDTTVLATAVYKREPLPPGGTDFLPLQVGAAAAAADTQPSWRAGWRVQPPVVPPSDAGALPQQPAPVTTLCTQHIPLHAHCMCSADRHDCVKAAAHRFIDQHHQGTAATCLTLCWLLPPAPPTGRLPAPLLRIRPRAPHRHPA